MSTCRLLYVWFGAKPLKDHILIEELCVFRLDKERASLTHEQRTGESQNVLTRLVRVHCRRDLQRLPRRVICAP